jgi:hypothetical protein
MLHEQDVKGAGRTREEAPRRFHCAFCGDAFAVEPDRPIPLRYEGRLPLVECPTCEADRLPAPR